LLQKLLIVNYCLSLLMVKVGIQQDLVLSQLLCVIVVEVILCC